MGSKNAAKTRTSNDCSKKEQCFVETFSAADTRGASKRISPSLAETLKSYNDSPHKGKANNGYFTKVQGAGI
jgi:hypothetical protein